MTPAEGRAVPHFTFPQTHHMKTPAEFDRCYARKRSASDGLLVVYACENGLTHPRLGCSVSRKVGNAVVRNRYKRLFREAFRLAQHDLPAGVDLILIPRPGPYPPLEPLKVSVVKLARQAARKLGEGKKPTPSPAAAPPPLKGRGKNCSPPLAGGEEAPSSPASRSDALSPRPFSGGGAAAGDGVGPPDAGAAP